MSNAQCEFHGHYWGRGEVTGTFVCCRKRCTAQAVCSVCSSGFVPRGCYAITCPMHTPLTPVSAKRVVPPLGLVDGSPSQPSLWEREGAPR